MQIFALVKHDKKTYTKKDKFATKVVANQIVFRLKFSLSSILIVELWFYRWQKVNQKYYVLLEGQYLPLLASALGMYSVVVLYHLIIGFLYTEAFLWQKICKNIGYNNIQYLSLGLMIDVQVMSIFTIINILTTGQSLCYTSYILTVTQFWWFTR